MSADDDADVLAKLAALDAEVKADADKKKAETARKAEIIAELRRREAAKKAAAAPKEAPKPAPAAAPKEAPKPRRKPAPPPEPEEVDVDDAIETAMTVARGAKVARAARAELSKPREADEKSWVASGLLSLFFGPLGWLYACSLRETIPAAFFWLVAAAIATKLPLFLIMPVMMVALPISGIGGVVYAIQYNRHGKRQRLFGKDPEPEPKKLHSGKKR